MEQFFAYLGGTWAALREGRVSDGIVRVTSQFGVSIPDFWLGVLLILVFSANLGLLPSSGYVALAENPAGWVRSVTLPAGPNSARTPTNSPAANASA